MWGLPQYFEFRCQISIQVLHAVAKARSIPSEVSGECNSKFFYFFKFFQGTIRACVWGKLVRLVDIRWCFQPTSLSHPISNRKSHRFIFQVFRIGVEIPKLGFKVKDRSAFYLCDYISSRNRVHYWTYRVLVSDFEQILQTHCNTYLLVLIRNYKPCHVQLKYGCPIKKSDHIRASCSQFSWTEVSAT